MSTPSPTDSTRRRTELQDRAHRRCIVPVWRIPRQPPRR
jgi:hypothetical protein